MAIVEQKTDNKKTGLMKRKDKKLNRRLAAIDKMPQRLTYVVIEKIRMAFFFCFSSVSFVQNSNKKINK